MCDIKKKCDVPSKTVYKAVAKEDGKYFSVFYDAHIQIGSTEDIKVYKPNFNRESDPQFNQLVKDKNLVTAFEKIEFANELLRMACYTGKPAVIKIVFIGEIYEGTANGIGMACEKNIKTYAGNFIESIEEM